MKSVINLAAASTILFSLTCTLVSQLWATSTSSIPSPTRRHPARPLPGPANLLWHLRHHRRLPSGGTHPETFSLCVLRRGSVDALLQFVIRALGGGIEVVWATPITESFGLALGLVLLRRFWGTWIDA